MYSMFNSSELRDRNWGRILASVIAMGTANAMQASPADQAITALPQQMQTPPVSGTKIPLPDTHAAEQGTALIAGRETLRDRVAVVHVGLRAGRTFMAVDRLHAGPGPKGET